MQFRDVKGKGKVFSHEITQPFPDSQAFNFVQSPGASDASCSCLCGKETTKILLTMNRVLMCGDEAREEWLFLHKES